MATLQPYIVEIKKDSEKHTKVLSFIMSRVQQARNRQSDRLDKWQTAENIFSAYVKETEADSRRRTSKKEQGFPTYTTVTIPYSYATLLTAHTYWTSVFLARDPIHQFQGNSGEAQDGEQAVEAMISYFLITGRNLVQYYIWLMDQGKYGEGIIGMTWDVERTFIPEARIVQPSFAGLPVPFATPKREWSSREVIGYQGIRLFNVRPHDFLHDPTVTLANFQQGEFAGHDGFVAMPRIKDGEALGKYYNTDYIEPIAQSRRATGTNNPNGLQMSPGMNLPSAGGSGDGAMGCDLTEITIELVPRDLELAPRDYLEKWSFTVANDAVIISAQPQGWYHNEFMYDVLEHEIEGYNTSKRGMLELLQPLNETLDWLFNSHFYNVRKVLNDQIIYDPSVLVAKDVEGPGPGKLIRVRPERFGTDVRTAFYQMAINDVTQNNLRDAGLVIEMMQRLTGVNDTVMGMLNNTRRTATEVRSSSSFSVNRLKTQCEYYSAMGFSPHASRMVKVAQQMYMGRPADMRRIVGNQGMAAARFTAVGPDEIAGSYDYVPVDGTMPIDRQAQAAVFSQMLQQMAGIPQVAQAYDWARLFGYGATLSGVRNLERFRVNVVPDAQVQTGAQAGNLVPMTATGVGAPQDMVMNGAGINVATGGQ
jgi:hypothetical protein